MLIVLDTPRHSNVSFRFRFPCGYRGISGRCENVAVQSDGAVPKRQGGDEIPDGAVIRSDSSTVVVVSALLITIS